MDISDINKVAGRKRMSSEVEKLREKVSRENKKIIKLKVAQDTAYWDLKEKLRQVETNHDQLQQNMLDVQMQYETVSGQYQEELRHRPEIMNKLASSREICNVLVEHSERLRESLSRCKADQTALYDAYQQSTQVVKDMKAQQLQNDEKTKLTIENLQDKLKMTTDHQSQLVQYFTSEKQRVDNELAAAKSELAAALTAREQLTAANAERGRQLEQCRQDLEKKEETVSRLQRDVKKMIQEFNSQATEMKNEMIKIEKELKEATSSNESLKKALSNQEGFSKSVCEQNNTLQEKLVGLEHEHGTTVAVVGELRANLQNASKINEMLKMEMENLSEKTKNLEVEISEKAQLIEAADKEKQELQSKISLLEAERSDVGAALKVALEEAQGMADRIQALTLAGGEREKQIEGIEVALKAARDAADAKITELSSTIEAKNLELDSKASTISHLMTEVNVAVEGRAKLEMTLANVRQDMERERDAVVENEKRMTVQIERLEVSVRNKDEELSRHMNIIMELRSDKERLHDKIQSMQSKIDNIQKELTGPTLRAPALQPELDDNAVMLTPELKRQRPAPMKEPQFPAPRADHKHDSLFNFLSDSSIDGDNTIDATEVNRRFEALSRGERLSPVPLSALKRRRAAVPIPHGGVRPKPQKRADPEAEDQFSLSQVKESMKSKTQKFFKHNRHEAKPKKNIN